jgi:curved DNA-binding protein CbpA
MSDRRVAEVSPSERALADRSTRVSQAPLATLKQLPLTSEESFVVSRVEGEMTIADLMVVCGLSEERALPALLSLVTKGALVLATETKAPPSRAPVGKPSLYGDYIFNRRELLEEVDLDQEKKKQILFLFNHLDRISHYRLLGVPATSSPAEIRKAFLQRSKELHPDSFFRKNLGTYKGRIEQIFRRLKGAHDVLMDEESRAKYDREAKHFSPQEVAEVSKRQIELLENEQRIRVRRERLLRAKGFARLTMARDLQGAGDKALQDGNVKEAIHNYQLALEVDPRLEDARSKMEEARRVANVQRADAAVERAANAEAEGNLTSALALLRSAVEVDPSNARTQAALAKALLDQNVELGAARVHARRAWDLGDHSSNIRVLTGEILMAMGQKKQARAEWEAAAEMGDARAEALLKKRK